MPRQTNLAELVLGAAVANTLRKVAPLLGLANAGPYSTAHTLIPAQAPSAVLYTTRTARLPGYPKGHPRGSRGDTVWATPSHIPMP